MEDAKLSGNPDFFINNILYLHLKQKKGHKYSFKTGKPDYSFIFVESGEMLFSFGDIFETAVIKSGSFFAIPKNLGYTVYYKENSTVSVITFNVFQGTAPSFLNAPKQISSPEISEIFGRIKENALFLTGTVYELCAVISGSFREFPEKYKKISPALDEINRLYFENKKLSYYAALCNTCESNFRRLFKEYTGKSFVEYRNDIRIMKAEKLISSKECSVSEAAYIVGFNNVSFFYEYLNKHRRGKKL